MLTTPIQQSTSSSSHSSCYTQAKNHLNTTYQYVRERFIPTESIDVKNEEPSPLKDRITAVISSRGKKTGLPTLINASKYKYTISQDYIPPSPSRHLEVSQDRAIVCKVSEVKPYATQIGASIVVQLRGLSATGEVSHLGLSHVSRNLETFKASIDDMLSQTDGQVELFISGGKSQNEKLYQAIRRHIENVQDLNRGRLTLKDDYFKAADLSSLIQDQRTPIHGLARLERSGFDNHNNPFMILDFEKSL